MELYLAGRFSKLRLLIMACCFSISSIDRDSWDIWFPREAISAGWKDLVDEFDRAVLMRVPNSVIIFVISPSLDVCCIVIFMHAL